MTSWTRAPPDTPVNPKGTWTRAEPVELELHHKDRAYGAMTRFPRYNLVQRLRAKEKSDGYR